MSHCRFLSRSKKKKRRSCANRACKCDKNICFCQTQHAPVIKQLPEKLSPGTCITVDGLIEENCCRFAVNLACSEDGDVALHLNPRLAQKYVMRNSRINGRWGEPEVTSPARFDLARNKPFQVCILIAEREFLVAFNGRHFCGYVFRLPPHRLRILQVFGPVKVHKVDYQDVQRYPLDSPKVVPVMLTVGMNSFSASGGRVVLPLTAFLVRGFRRGFQIEINGRIKVHPCGFFINLQDGPAVWPPANLHLHVNFRFDAEKGKHQVLVNTRIDGKWGRTVLDQRPFFQPTSSANILILRAKDHFRIWLDGELLLDFDANSNYVDMIDTLYIQGDITICPPIDIVIKKDMVDL